MIDSDFKEGLFSAAKMARLKNTSSLLIANIADWRMRVPRINATVFENWYSRRLLHFKEEFEIWGRNFQLDVSLACHSNQVVLDSQVRIFNTIKNKLNELYDVCRTKIYEYMHNEERKELFPNNEIPENIFKFIIPKAIIVTRHTDVDYFGFLFYFRYDRENNICGSFKNYEFFEVEPEYIIL